MFGLAEFWSRDLDDEVQFVGSEISEGLKSRGETASEANCRRDLEELAKRKRGRVGQDSLAIVSSAFYDHILTSPSLLSQIVRICVQGTWGINIGMISTSEIKIAVTVDETRIEDAARAVHDAFGLDKAPA